MIVVVIIGLLAALALPAFQRVHRNAQVSRAANDLRVFAQAFETYATEHGGWPPNAGAGVVPPALAGDLKVGTWRADTAIGGRWNWDRANFGFAAGISIVNFTVPDAQLEQIDARIDDGNLSTGLFQKISANRVTLILEP